MPVVTPSLREPACITKCLKNGVCGKNTLLEVGLGELTEIGTFQALRKSVRSEYFHTELASHDRNRNPIRLERS